MNEFPTALPSWALQTAIVGAVVLGLGRLALGFSRTPQGRFRVAAWTLRTVVLVPPLCVLPAWWSMPAAALSLFDAKPAAGLRKTELASRFSAQDFVDDVVPPLPPPQTDADVPNFNEADFLPAPVLAPDLPPPTVTAEAVAVPLPQSPERFAEAEPTLAPEAEVPTLPSRAEALMILGGAFLIAACWFAFDFARGYLALRRLRRASLPASIRVQAAASTLLNGIKPTPRVLTHANLSSPVCFGVLRPTIVLPKPLASTMPADELTWVLAHETDHLRRGDPLLGWVTGAARCWFFFVPMFWSVRRELRTAQELLADAAAVAAGGRPAEYAAFLVRLSTGTTTPTEARALPAHAVRAGRSQLFRRVTMILNTKPGASPGGSRRWSLLTAGGLLSAAVVLSGLNLVRADDAKPKEGDKPKEERKEADKPREGERDPLRRPDFDKPRPSDRRDADKPRDGDRPSDMPVEVRIVNVGPIDMAKVASLKRQIAAAVKEGDVESAMKFVNELEKTLSGPSRVMNPPAQPMPSRPPYPTAPQSPDRIPPQESIPPAPPAYPALVPPTIFTFPQPQEAQFLEVIRALRAAQSATTDANSHEAFRKAIYQLVQQRDAARIQNVIINPGSVQPLPGGGFGGTAMLDPNGVPALPVVSSPLRTAFGLTVVDLPEALAEQLQLDRNGGVLVSGVVVDSIAGVAGLRVNDVVTKVNGTGITGGARAAPQNIMKPGNDKIVLTVIRKGKEATVIMDRPLPALRPAVVTGPSLVRPKEKVRFDSLNTNVEDGKFTIKAKKGNAVYDINGKLDKSQPTELVIVVTVDGKKITPNDDGRMPGDHDRNVKALLETVRGQ